MTRARVGRHMNSAPVDTGGFIDAFAITTAAILQIGYATPGDRPMMIALDPALRTLKSKQEVSPRDRHLGAVLEVDLHGADRPRQVS